MRAMPSECLVIGNVPRTEWKLTVMQLANRQQVDCHFGKALIIDREVLRESPLYDNMRVGTRKG